MGLGIWGDDDQAAVAHPRDPLRSTRIPCPRLVMRPHAAAPPQDQLTMAPQFLRYLMNKPSLDDTKLADQEGAVQPLPEVTNRCPALP